MERGRRGKQRLAFVRFVFLAPFGNRSIAHLTLSFVKKRLICPFEKKKGNLPKVT